LGRFFILMGRRTLVIFLILSVSILHAQKVIRKTIADPSSTRLLIDAEHCFKIELTTVESEELIIEAKIDGEYRNDLLINIEELDATIKLSAGFQPNFVKPNDKLSAHKVISIALKIKAPQSLDVHLYGTSCNVNAIGSYNSLRISLDDGICFLDTVSENTSVDSNSGDIHLKSKGATIEARSNFGKVTSDRIPYGNNYFRLSTVTGNIYLTKIE